MILMNQVLVSHISSLIDLESEFGQKFVQPRFKQGRPHLSVVQLLFYLHDLNKI